MDSEIYALSINVFWFTLAFIFSRYFLTTSLFQDQEIKHKLNKYIFSTTFGLCAVMLVMFLQEVIQVNDIATSQVRWKFIFLVMDLHLMFVIPLALLKQFVQLSTKNKLKNKVAITICVMACLLVLFLTYILYFKYVVISQDAANTFFARIYDLFKSTNSQLEFLTLIGIIVNAFMQGYVCSNHIYVYLIENLENSPHGKQPQNEDVYYHNYDLSNDGNINLYEYHQRRIHNVLEQIAFNKRKILKIEYEISKLKVSERKHVQPKKSSSFLTNLFGLAKLSEKLSGQGSTKVTSDQLERDLDEFRKDVKILQNISKNQTYELMEYVKWQNQVNYRQTFYGQFAYYFGKILAILWINKFYKASRNIYLKPVYQQQQMSNNFKFIMWILRSLGLYDEADEVYWRLIVQYITLIVIGIIIASNVQSFLRNLLFSIKNVLKDYSIKLSYNTTILIFSFIMGSYYLSTLLQLSMKLPVENREPFKNLLDKFNSDFVFYTSDCVYIISSLISGSLIFFNWSVNKSTF